MTSHNPMPSQRCGRKRRDGGRCTQWAMHGQTVCKMHGGMAAQNKLAAEARLRALEHPAISALEQLIERGDPDATRLAAARYLLELLGHKAAVQVEAEQEVTIRVIDERVPVDYLAPRVLRTAEHNGADARRN